MRGAASSLGELSWLGESRCEDDKVNGGDDPIDYYRFTLRAERSRTGLGLRQHTLEPRAGRRT